MKLELPIGQPIRIRSIFREDSTGEHLVHLFLDGNNLKFESNEYFRDDFYRNAKDDQIMTKNELHEAERRRRRKPKTFRVLHFNQDESFKKSYYSIKQLIVSNCGQCYITIVSFDKNGEPRWSFTFIPKVEEEEAAAATADSSTTTAALMAISP